MKIGRILLTMAALATVIATEAQRVTFDINSDWDFRRNDTEEWQKVNLPHDFQISQPWVEPDASERPDNSDVASNIKSRLSPRGFKEMGNGIYRKNLQLPDSLQGKRLLIDFEGMMLVGDVYLNGERIGGTDYGYVGFEIDITKKIKWGQANELTVVCSTREPLNSRWYTGGGLIRGVHIVATNTELYFGRHPLYVTTRDNKYVSVGGEFTNYTRKPVRTTVKIYDPNGQLVFEGGKTIQRHPMARTVEVPMTDEVTINNPQLWDTESPNLYRAVVQLIHDNGNVVDEVSTNFGIRTIDIVPNRGLLLNGKKVLLQGYANHHSLGALGAAAYPRAIEKRILLMKQFGMNHIRTSHNPYSREFIEMCDRYGILVVDELYDKWTRQHTGGRVDFEQLWQKDIPEWVKRDRNSPSVVLWSLGNELQQDANQPFNDFGVTMYRLMRPLINRYDSTRLVTVAMHPRYRNWETDSLPANLAMLTDVQSYNYRYMYFPGDGRRFPWMKFYQSEASVAAMGQNFFEMDRDKTIGLAYWGAIDYLGESQGWPEKGWSQGVFYISLDPKPKAYLMKSMFCEAPVVHIGIVEKGGDNSLWNGINTSNAQMSENWNRAQGTKCTLLTYTNADEVELLLNGRSLGTKKNDKSDAKQRNQIKWNDVAYESGTLEAVARTNGKVVARHKIETTGDAVKLTATPDNNNWKADGMDLQHVSITAVDKKGRRVFGANEKLTFSVEGDAEIVAVSNGDIASDESCTGNSRKLWLGSALVILRSGKKASDVTLKITSDKYKTVTVKLKTL